MCGRYTLAVQLDFLVERFGCDAAGLHHVPRYNIAPGQMAPVIVMHERNRLQAMRWGLVPSWAKDEAIGNKMINARAETLDQKPSFRKSLESRRCIVPADGFYEWRIEPGGRGKTPVRILLKDRQPFGMAGLWDVWRTEDGTPLFTYTIVTTGPNSLIRSVHNRMPVILCREAEQTWLSRETESSAAKKLLSPFPSEQMEMYEVTKVVNSPKTDAPACIEPAC